MRSGLAALGSFILCLAIPAPAGAQSNPVTPPSIQGSPQIAAPLSKPEQLSAATARPSNLRDQLSGLNQVVDQRNQSASAVQTCAHIIVYQAGPQSDSGALIPSPRNFADNVSIIRAMPPCPEDIRGLSGDLPLRPYRGPHPFIPPHPRLQPLAP